MNGLDHKVEFRLGDLTEPVRGERFDHVVCNPPLLPVPERLSYPLVGDGGPDGLALTRRVLEVLPALLNEDGRCHIVGTCLGGPRGPDTGCFEEAARDLRVFVMFPWRDRLVPGQPMFESLVASVCLHGEPDREMVSRTYERHLARAGATHLYSFFFYAFRGAGQTGFECSRHFMDPRTIWGR